MNKKFIVPFDTARQLREKGYDVDCYSYYTQNGKLYHDTFTLNNKWIRMGRFLAPTYHEVVDWLEGKNIIVEVDWLFEDVSSRNICFYYRVAFIHPNFPCKDKGYIGIHNIQLTREEALNEGILKALEML